MPLIHGCIMYNLTEYSVDQRATKKTWSASEHVHLMHDNVRLLSTSVDQCLFLLDLSFRSSDTASSCD